MPRTQKTNYKLVQEKMNMGSRSCGKQVQMNPQMNNYNTQKRRNTAKDVFLPNRNFFFLLLLFLYTKSRKQPVIHLLLQ